MRINADLKDWRHLENTLDRINRRAIPYAERATANAAAFEVQKEARKTLPEQFQLRNRWTMQSIRVNRANFRQPYAEVGSVNAYMALQEHGGTKQAQGRTGVAIPTPDAAGQRGVRTRLPTRRNRLANIRLRHANMRAANQKQRNAIKIAMARRRGGGVVYLKTGRTEGLFRVTSTRVRMLYDLSRNSVVVPASPWLLPAAETVVPRLPQLYARALRYQLRRVVSD